MRTKSKLVTGSSCLYSSSEKISLSPAYFVSNLFNMFEGVATDCLIKNDAHLVQLFYFK